MKQVVPWLVAAVGWGLAGGLFVSRLIETRLHRGERAPTPAPAMPPPQAQNPPAEPAPVSPPAAGVTPPASSPTAVAPATPQVAAKPPAATLRPAPSRSPSGASDADGLTRSGQTIVMTEAYRQKLLSQDLPLVLNQARATPNMVGGKLNGFVIQRIKPGSLYERAGLENGDVIEAINGVGLSDVGQTINMLNSLKGAKQVGVRIRRGGQPLDLTIKVQ